MAKKYKLHCFNCGVLFNSKKEVHRVNGLPYCFECHGEYLCDQNYGEIHEYEMKRWHDEHPNQDYDQYRIDQANIHKYGEC